MGGGLAAAGGGDLKGFFLAGADHQFQPASATIRGATIVVQSPQVPAPVAVRYAWANNPMANLTNVEGFPAAAFRADEWELRLDQ